MAIFRSILITSIISGVLSGIGYGLGYNFLKLFFIFFCVQYAGFFVISYVRDAFIIINNKKIELAKLEEYTKYGIEANCAFCNSTNYIPVRLDEENDFICEDCGKENAIYVNITIAQKTEMISSNRLVVSSYIKEHEDVKKQIIENED